jgi:hypothetical protein
MKNSLYFLYDHKRASSKYSKRIYFRKNTRSKSILQLQLERTIELELGWVFFYQTKAYIETGDVMKALIGNAPIIINKQTGAIHVTGTAHRINHYIIKYFQQEEKKQKRDSEGT